MSSCLKQTTIPNLVKLFSTIGFERMSFEDILISLIDHPILGTLSQRFIEYRVVSFPSVIPISYEQIISSNSGGNDKTFEDNMVHDA